MTLPPFLTLERELVADCRVFRVHRLRRRSGRTGLSYDYFRLDMPDWVNVVPVTPAGELVLVRQERHGLGETTLEIPGGLVDLGETPAQAALRELREETGFSGAQAEALGWVHPNPALQGNRCHTFLVRNAALAGPPQPGHDEEIEVVLVPFEQVRALVREGRITHALVIAGLYLYDLRAGSPPRRT